MRCRGRNEEGKSCGAPEALVDESSGYCIAHGPDGPRRLSVAGKLGAAATRKAWRGKGLDEGELGPLETPADAERWLRVTGEAVAVGRLTDRAANALSKAVDTWLRAHAGRVEAEEIAELRERIGELRKPRAV